MDLLKQELQRKRQALQPDFGGKKLLKRSEIEHKNLQTIREEEQRKTLQSKKPTQSPQNPQSPNPYSQSQNPSDPQSSLPLALQSKKNPPETLTKEQKINVLDLPKQEVIRRLRILKKPVTLFGEDAAARLDRLKLTLKSGVLEIDSDMIEGQTNDFLRDTYELQKRQKSGLMNERKKEKRGEDNDGGDDEKDGDGDGDGGSSGMDVGDKDGKRMNANFEELCDEDKILVFFKRLLNEWNQELDDMQEEEKRKTTGKSMVAKFKQCERYLHLLFKFCRKKVLPDDIRQALMVVVRCCMKRDYLAAMDQHIKMAIGNAPWPIGVTMVGIHESSAREKIYTNSVAHIMNDETTRKYLQSVKRLITFCQRRYPTDPSKSVEFNKPKKDTKLKEFLNKPLAHFDDSRLIIGDDFATGEFKKSVFEKFGKIPFSTVHMTIDPLTDLRHDAASADEIVDQPIGGSGGSSGPIRIPNALGGGSMSTKPRKKKQVFDEDVMRMMVDKVGDLSNAIRQTIPTHWTVQLSQCVYGHLDYDDVVLDTAYARLFESEMVARFFIAKPLEAQKRYLDELAKELKRNVLNSRARVEKVSSSDEDGDGGNEDEMELTV